MPSGQHLKNTSLPMAIIMMAHTENKIAKAMASTTGWNSSTDSGAPGNDQSLNNSSGFNAFPEGYRTLVIRSHEGYSAIFWSSTEYNSDNAMVRYLIHCTVTLTGSRRTSETAFRCVLLGIKNLDS